MPTPSRPTRNRVRLVFAVACGVTLSLVLSRFVSFPVAQSPDPCAPPLGNPIKCENALAGNPSSEWDVSGAGDTSIQGFATDISAAPGGTVQFKIKTTAGAYRIDIYRIGYYGGRGARKVATVNPSVTLPQSQPNCMTQVSTGLVDCGNWAVSASWTVPATAVSGVYIARPRRNDTGGASHIIFVVRNDTSRSDLLFQTADTTWAAYNEYGGNSLYVGSPAGRAYKVSYNRPLTIRTSPTNSTEIVSNTRWRSSFFLTEYPLIRFLEANGYDLSYSSSLDSDRRGAELLEHKVFLSTGHDEYWSAAHRTNVEAARDAGVHLAFFSANTSFWKTRWENSIAPGAAPYRTLVTYKETLSGSKIDPSGVWTGTWRDKKFSPPYDGGRPENALKGTLYMFNCCQTASLLVSADEGQRRLWRNTALASLPPGGSQTFGTATVGFEVDSDLDNGARPAGLLHLATNTLSSSQWYLLDAGANYGAGTGNHSVTLYKQQSSGALVFSSSAMQWAWGLDATHDKPSGLSTPIDSRIRQATVNLLADMGVQPATLQSGLVAAVASNDLSAPSATITYPSASYKPGPGEALTITGSAADVGGVPAGVEVSTDGGVTWRPAAGTPTNWSYSWVAPTSGAATLAARAVDDSGNLQSLPTAVTVSVAPVTCPCSFWDPATTTPTTGAVDATPYELGIKFKSSQSGRITGLRFYKDASNVGTHVGRLWSASGTQLASVTFTNESASGWQTAMFSSPVSITANTTYVASYFVPVANGSYALGFFSASLTRGPLSAAAGAGVYREVSSGFPTDTWEQANFWVDVIFETGTASDTTPPTVTAVTPTNGSTGVSTSTTVTATLSEALLSSSVTSATATLVSATNQAVSASVSYSATNRRITLTPSAALTAGASYTARLVGGSAGIKDAAGNALAADYSWGFTTAGTDTTPPGVSGVTPAGGATGVSVSTTVTATFNEAMQSASVSSSTVTVRNASNQLVAASVSYNTSTRVVTLTPTAPLSAGATYTARISGGSTGVKDSAGNALAADYSWSFATAAASTCPCSIWDPATTTPIVMATDPNPYELGLRFSSSAAGKITGIRFYKDAANTGTHTAKLWTSTGTLLAQATFTGETATGWQTATFATPVSISAGTTYVASYYAPVANSVYTVNFFAAPLVKGTLTASQGVYRDTGASGFPLWEWQNANFWVDVIFVPN